MEFSIHRPFGIYLWDQFDKVMTAVSGGRFVPSEFEFVPNQLPFSDHLSVVKIITAYYVVIFGGRYLQNAYEIKPLRLASLFKLHNFLLTAVSFVLLVLMIEQLIPIISQYGLFYAICSPDAWTQPLVTLYYLNYLTKYLEFVDTLFLVVKGKPLTFLHTYHHGATAFLCYTQLLGNTSISWVVISLNLFVHVIMYWYYFLAACGVRVWWKQWVTRMQIVQFIIDIGFIYFASYIKFASQYYPQLPHCGTCAGKDYAAVCGVMIISSYLLLFIAFYIRVYIKKVQHRRARSLSKADEDMKATVAASSAIAKKATTVKSRKA